MTGSLTERYDDRIAGVLSCYDRVVMTGTLPTVCYAAGMTKFLYAIGVRIFDYPQFASTLRERAGGIAGSAGGDHDRAHRQEPHPQGSSRGGGTETTWRTPRPGACHLGNGGVRCLPALARQANAQDLRAAG